MRRLTARTRLPVWIYGTAFALFISAFFVTHVPLNASEASISNGSIVFFAAPSFVAAYRWLGVRRFLMLIAALSVFALAIEATSILTGFPYGKFAYGDMIGGRIGGLVPWTVPFAWVPLVLGVWGITRNQKVVRRIAICGLLLVAVDLLLDPAAVRLHFWRYDHPSRYYGVPASNYAGWLLTGCLGAAACWLSGRSFPEPSRETGYSLLLILVFWASVAGWAGMAFPALIGVALVVVAAVTSGRK